MVIRCESCGSPKFFTVKGYTFCEYCGSSLYLDEPDRDDLLDSKKITIDDLRNAIYKSKSLDYCKPIYRGGIRL